LADAALRALEAGRGQGAAVYIAGQWLVNYDADAVPENSTPAWAKHLLGEPTIEDSGGILSIANTGPTAGVWYSIANADLNANGGVVLESRLKVTAGTATVDQGACLVICDGAHRFIAWLRKAGANIQGQANFAVDLSRYRRVKLVTQADTAKLYVDGSLRQVGSYCETTTDLYVGFGSYYAP
jgi:hypothetical protein